MLKRMNISTTTRRQVQNNIGLVVPARNSSISQDKIINTEPSSVSSVSSDISGSGVTQSQAVEQANAIQFGSGVKRIQGLNKYSDMKSSILHKELPIGDGCHTVSGSGLGPESELPLGKAKLPGEILKRKLLLKMLKDKDKSVALGITELNAGSQSGGADLSGVLKIIKNKLKEGGITKGTVNKGGTQGGFWFLLPLLVGAISTAVSKTPSKNFGDFMSNAWKKGIYYKVGQAIQGRGGETQGIETPEQAMAKIKLKLSDFPQSVQLIIKKSYDDMKDNPTVQKIQALGEKIAPDVRKAFGEKLKTKANLVVNPLIQPPPVGSGRVPLGKKYSGKGFNEATQKFDDDFAKNLVKELT